MNRQDFNRVVSVVLFLAVFALLGYALMVQLLEVRGVGR